MKKQYIVPLISLFSANMAMLYIIGAVARKFDYHFLCFLPYIIPAIGIYMLVSLYRAVQK